MKRILAAAALVVALTGSAWAKNFAFPKDNPAATITIPDSWTTEAIDFGFAAKSPDEGVFFSVESASAARLDKMMELNVQWMKDNKITATGKAVEREIELNGMKATLLSYPATDEAGETTVEFALIAAPGNRVIMLTLWASDEERAANEGEIRAIQRSIKPIN
ncbi:hypothetical protein [Enterovirga sp.]|jgi:hypothetical protein|uniref:hypothetical protein n=1 Tax=Enterovirga sp. TaxID=2026350 RepID=UPI00261646D1|nr:hypothetical protein [Enterovirga sp.]MDB5592114.1 hypothetical protein [Enterovirga sp.]